MTQDLRFYMRHQVSTFGYFLKHKRRVQLIVSQVLLHVSCLVPQEEKNKKTVAYKRH